ncbi:unnamed protein product [Peronospora destructor]|uniref:Uncharacterized protein n=1 Tax=Peronospora destructor TaxID=86335 RepID=A0AAV0TJV7_9STRA|nr:unnamed protein product [Peronospora destructor]
MDTCGVCTSLDELYSADPLREEKYLLKNMTKLEERRVAGLSNDTQGFTFRKALYTAHVKHLLHCNKNIIMAVTGGTHHGGSPVTASASS